MIQVLEAGELEQLNFIYERRGSKKNTSVQRKDNSDRSLDLKKEKEKIKDRISQLK